MSLFGDDEAANATAGRPPIIPAVRWVDAVKLEKEREIVGTYHSANPLDPFFMELRFGTMSLKTFSELTPTEGTDIMLGGMVLDFTSRPSKKGGNFGILKIQDYSGSAEFMLFGQDYIDYHNYGVPGTPVLIRGSFSRRFQNSEIRFKVNSVQLLNDIKGHMISGVTINVTANMLNEMLHGVLSEHIRTQSEEMGHLRFRIQDPQSGRSVTLDTSLKIPVNKELVEKLEDLDIDFRIDRA